MKTTTTLWITIVLVIISALFNPLFSQADDQLWPMFRYDARHGGRCPRQGPVADLVLRWSYQTRDDIAFSSPAVSGDGEVFVGSLDNNLYAIDSQGRLHWSYASGDDIDYSSPALGAGGEVYIGAGYEDQRFYCIQSSGVLGWSYELNDGSLPYPVCNSPAIRSSDGRIYVGVDYVEGKMICFNSVGTLHWSYCTSETMHGVESSPAVANDGKVYYGSSVYFGTSPLPRFYALNADGSRYWTFILPDTVFSSPALGTDGVIYCGGNDNKQYALKSDGTLKWSYAVASHVEVSQAIGEDGRLFTGSHDNNIYAFTSNGKLSWSYRTGLYVKSSPAISGDGTVYIGSDDNRLYALRSDGSLCWSYATLRDVYSSPAIGEPGMVCVGSEDGVLYAFQGSTPTPYVTSTPTSPAAPTSTPTPPFPYTPFPTVPPTAIKINNVSVSTGEHLSATFELTETIRRPFTVFAVIILPDGSMLNALTLLPDISPVAVDVPVLYPPFSYPLISTTIPAGAPAGLYELVVAFFDPVFPIRGRADAFLDISVFFSVS